MATFEEISILGTKITPISLEKLFSYILWRTNNQQKTVIASANVNAINIAYNNHIFQKTLNDSEIVLCDGFGVSLACRYLYGRSIQRYTHMDFIYDFLRLCEKHKKSVFFLGSEQKVIHKLIPDIEKKYPQLCIKGAHHGYFNKIKTAKDNLNLLALLNKKKPDILFIGFGMPIQEKWIHENKKKLNVKIIMPVGGLFDYMAGVRKRGPQFLTQHGFEWLCRLIYQPVYFWKRYIFGIPVFMIRLICSKLFHY